MSKYKQADGKSKQKSHALPDPLKTKPEEPDVPNEATRQADSNRDARDERQVTISEAQLKTAQKQNVTNVSIAIFTFLLVLVSIVGNVVSWLSAKAANSAAKTAVEALNTSISIARSDQRAWIGVVKFSSSTQNGASQSPYVVADRDITFVAQIINSGKSPAKLIKSGAAFQLQPATSNFDPVFVVRGDPIQSKFVIQPNAMHYLQTPVTRFSAVQVNAIRNGSMVFYVYGEVTYKDVFELDHFTRFCAFVQKTLDSFTGCAWNDAN